MLTDRIRPAAAVAASPVIPAPAGSGMNGAPGATPAEAERAAADLAAWEAFLRRTPAGQFQQAAGWARARTRARGAEGLW